MQLASGPKFLIILGIVLVVAGVVWHFLSPHIQFGKLPGDFAYEKENVKVYFPLATSILLSVALSAILWVINKFF
jgi:hypothetical protein